MAESSGGETSATGPEDARLEPGAAQVYDSLLPNRFTPWQRVSSGVLSFGINAWLLIGIAAVLALAAWAVAATSSISIPLIIGGVLGILFYPIVGWLHKRRVPKAVGALVVLLLLLVLVAVTVWITASGVIDQWPAITKSFSDGVASARDALKSQFGLSDQQISAFITQAEQQAVGNAGNLAGGAASRFASGVFSGLSGALGFLFGAFLGTVILYYFLTDWPNIESWLGSHIGVPVDIGQGIISDASDAIRGYFQGVTLSGLAVAVVIGVAMWLLGVPLAFSVAVVTFLTCYIPFFGAIISGAFAFFIALGTAGLDRAIVVLIVVLIAQNLLQTVINNKTMGDALDLHPVVVLVVTIVGGTIGGLLGSALAAPATALAVRVNVRMQKATAELVTKRADAEPAATTASEG